MPKKKTFEKAVERIEEIISEIEKNEITLEESVKLYKEAIELSAFCGESLNKIEKEVTILQKTAEGIFTEESFDGF